MISVLMMITSVAMLAFPKQLRGNRIPSPHQVETIDAHKAMQKVEEVEVRPQLKGIYKVTLHSRQMLRQIDFNT